MSEWRTGRKVFRTIYQDDELIGVMDTAELAETVVRAVNVVAAVRKLHQRIMWPLGKWPDAKFVCGYCINPDGVLSAWPCETIRALGGEA